MNLVVTQATASQAVAIAKMAIALTDEISEQMKAQHFELDSDETARRCAELLSNGKYIVLLATADNQQVGFVGMSEGYALYANGAIGTLQEFYVMPSFRSITIGTALIDAVKAYARERGWRRLEVCTPPLPEFDASLRFYSKNGFEVTGGRKMKIVMDVL
jgi:GNAT superfamily N-acetyltransferase